MASVLLESVAVHFSIVKVPANFYREVRANFRIAKVIANEND
jgi:hypothetical protein